MTEQDEKDLQELREYIEGILKRPIDDKRSVASHALELLKTFKSNYDYYSARSDMTQAAAQLEMARGWIERAVTALEKLENKGT